MSEVVVEKQMQRGETSSAVRQMLGKHLDPPPWSGTLPWSICVTHVNEHVGVCLFALLLGSFSLFPCYELF